jgi:hypothetical protein
MPAVDRITQAAIRSLDRIGGELLTLQPRNVTAWGMIDRVNKPPGKVESEISVQGNVGVTVYFAKRNLNVAPQVGEYVEESNGDKHMIGEIKDLGYRWQCLCSSEPIV